MSLTYLLPPGDFVSDHIRATGQPYELPILRELASRLWTSPAGTIIDAGAHIGNHALWLAEQLPEYTVNAYEPWPATFEMLANNRDAAGLSNLRIHNIALSNSHGGLALVRVDDNPGHVRALTPEDSPGSVAALEARGVGCVTIDGERLHDVRLIKIDVEGHEPQVIGGARWTIERDHPLLCVEDWTGKLIAPSGYRVAASWPDLQTYLLEYSSGS